MRQFNLKILAAIAIATFILTSCNQSSESEDTTRPLSEKENDLLQKGNEPLQNEQELHRRKVQQQVDTTSADNLNFLKLLDKKYPFEIKLLDNPMLQPRLKKMLGSQYEFMKGIWEVETPIEISNGFLYAWAMQAHSGGETSTVLMADIDKNVLYVGIRKDNKEKIYSEDGSDAPQKLKDWTIKH